MAGKRTYRKNEKPPRPITVPIYLQDPLVAEQTKNAIGLQKIELPGQHSLGPGPSSASVEVDDYDEQFDVEHPRVELLKSGGGFKLGRPQSGKSAVRNYKVHQCSVWGTIVHTLHYFERAEVLGRPIPWACEGGRLTVYPHSGVDENAYYDRDAGGLFFQYFEGNDGQTVYTCLSHDIVTHELGHAMLDGLKPYYNEISSAQTAAFHEYFGDAVAMTAALSHTDIAVNVAGMSIEKLPADTLVSRIADQFGSRLKEGAAKSLRTAGHGKTMASLAGTFREHDLSEVLSGAFYDILTALYKTRLEAEKRRRGKRRIDGGMCVAALISAARRTTRLMFRAIDYCPPVDLSFLDYARAVLRADEVGFPHDDDGYRKIVRDVFVKGRQIATARQLNAGSELRNDHLRPYDIKEVASTPTEAYRFVDANREALGIPMDANFAVTNLYRTNKESGRYYPPREIVIEFVWYDDIVLSDAPEFGDLAGEMFSLYCGGTLVFDGNGNVLHYVMKESTSDRADQLAEYIAFMVEEGYFGEEEGAEVALRRDGERLRMRRAPRLRHRRRSGSRKA